ncbi:MAG: YciI family protein [Myxococcales bacterium]|nr:YciI family protein [Myxococcales bacterium]MDD9969616.1 YciI family protein [Myxococcales bacterium]
MKYFVLLAGYGERRPWDELSAEEQAGELEKHQKFDAACGAKQGVEVLSSEALGDGSMATTLRTRGGEMTITDGPFAEAAEHIGGYYLLEAPDIDTVIELCRLLPAYDMDIRPVLDLS